MPTSFASQHPCNLNEFQKIWRYRTDVQIADSESIIHFPFRNKGSQGRKFFLGSPSNCFKVRLIISLQHRRGEHSVTLPSLGHTNMEGLWPETQPGPIHHMAWASSSGSWILEIPTSVEWETRTASWEILGDTHLQFSCFCFPRFSSTRDLWGARETRRMWMCTKGSVIHTARLSRKIMWPTGSGQSNPSRTAAPYDGLRWLMLVDYDIRWKHIKAYIHSSLCVMMDDRGRSSAVFVAQ